jgi:hypothetical protein
MFTLDPCDFVTGVHLKEVVWKQQFHEIVLILTAS